MGLRLVCWFEDDLDLDLVPEELNLQFHGYQLSWSWDCSQIRAEKIGVRF